MTREIKFRAWDEQGKIMLYRELFDMNWYTTEFNDNTGSHCWGAISGGQRNFIKPMLSTGLKDKNGKEIYEGDILSMHNGQYNSQVVWDTDRYIADHIGNGGSESITTFIEDLEIIGNIYENPELLKKYDK